MNTQVQIEPLDYYAWWRSAIAGQNPSIHENEPQCGYYRKRVKEGGK